MEKSSTSRGATKNTRIHACTNRCLHCHDLGGITASTYGFGGWCVSDTTGGTLYQRRTVMEISLAARSRSRPSAKSGIRRPLPLLSAFGFHRHRRPWPREESECYRKDT